MKKIPQLDYACRINERVWWPNMRGERFEGVIIDWDENIATVKLDDGSIKEIEC
jgi:hypothetical protein